MADASWFFVLFPPDGQRRRTEWRGDDVTLTISHRSRWGIRMQHRGRAHSLQWPVRENMLMFNYGQELMSANHTHSLTQPN